MVRRKYKGILIDDEESILSSYQFALEDYDFELTVFNRPAEALKYLNELASKQMKLDFIMSDYLMPEINGIEFFEEVPEFFREATMCILHSGSLPYAKKPMNIEYFSYLEKPIAMEALAKHLKNLITNYEEKKNVIEMNNRKDDDKTSEPK